MTLPWWFREGQSRWASERSLEKAGFVPQEPWCSDRLVVQARSKEKT